MQLGVIEWIAWFGAACAALPFAMTMVNLTLYRRAPRATAGAQERVDVCIPARNEAANLEACVRGVLASAGAQARALVYDDQSTDGTGAILKSLVETDARVLAVATRPLPDGWNGKQWGCERMGRASDAEWLLFTDADVRLAPGAVGSAVRFARESGSDLVSTVPAQRCETVGEALTIPMIHFVLLGYLPMMLMRRDARPALAAGCGQFLLVRRETWARSGGHAAFRASMHDGIKLPRSVRACGGRTDLFDGTDLVSCRMYRGLGQCWRGFVKNAYEGLGSFGTLMFFTVAHLAGHVMPWVLLALSLLGVSGTAGVALPASLAIAMGFITRAMLAWRFRQPWIGVLLHPVGVLLMTLIQWESLRLARAGRREWKGRVARA